MHPHSLPTITNAHLLTTSITYKLPSSLIRRFYLHIDKTAQYKRAVSDIKVRLKRLYFRLNC